MRELETNLRLEINKLFIDAYKYLEEEKLDLARTTGEAAWQKLPDSKFDWDYN